MGIRNRSPAPSPTPNMGRACRNSNYQIPESCQRVGLFASTDLISLGSIQTRWRAQSRYLCTWLILHPNLVAFFSPFVSFNSSLFVTLATCEFMWINCIYKWKVVKMGKSPKKMAKKYIRTRSPTQNLWRDEQKLFTVENLRHRHPFISPFLHTLFIKASNILRILNEKPWNS